MKEQFLDGKTTYLWAHGDFSIGSVLWEKGKECGLHYTLMWSFCWYIHNLVFLILVLVCHVLGLSF